ncbi:MAG: tetratricopeptide repeat protein [Acidobacteriota bacterium]|nr:tetratricopeptide repeat protein [Acidobacteriota bacterium]
MKANFKNLSLINVVLLFSLIGIGCFSNQTTDPNQLVKGNPVTNSVVNDEIHSYTVPLEKDQYLVLKIEQNDVDVIAEVFAPNGESLGEFDTPTSGRGTETVRIGAANTGDYKINIFTLSDNAEPGTYSLELADNRNLTDTDRKILSAVKFHQEADKLRAEAETRVESIPLYEKALEIWRETGEKADEGNTLRAMGFAYQRMDDLEKAKEHFGKALEIWEEIGDHRSAAFANVIFGVIAKKQNDLETGLQQDIKAQPLWIKAGDLPEATQNLVRIAGDYKKLGKKDESLAYYKQALEASKNIEKKSVKAYVYSSYGDALAEYGNKTEALEFYKQSLKLWKTLEHEKVVKNLQEKIDKLSVS